jgi:hypothetical protein
LAGWTVKVSRVAGRLGRRTALSQPGTTIADTTASETIALANPLKGAGVGIAGLLRPFLILVRAFSGVLCQPGNVLVDVQEEWHGFGLPPSR